MSHARLNALRWRYQQFTQASWPRRRDLLLKGVRLTGVTLTWTLVRVVLFPLAIIPAAFGVRFLYSPTLLTRIGHLAMEPYIYVRAEQLGLRPRRRAILLAPRRAVVNPALLDYWRSFVRVVQHPLAVALLRPFEGVWCLREETYPGDRLEVTTSDGRVIRGGPAQDEIEREYERRFPGRPFLVVRDEHRERGWRELTRLGVPRDAWFVCLHVREAGYFGDRMSYHSYRNADVNDYLPAVEAICGQGGWVIRMGDPTMKPLPRLPRVIDYVHTDARSDWMDVFCLGDCRFFLGTTAGPWNVSSIFGRPVVGTNVAPMGHALRASQDLFIPMLYRSKEGRYLSFREVLLSPVRSFDRTEDFLSAGVTWVNNTPDEIRAVTVEMLDRLDGRGSYSPEDERLQDTYRGLLLARPAYGTLSRVGRDFLRAHANLFEDTNAIIEPLAVDAAARAD